MMSTSPMLGWAIYEDNFMPINTFMEINTVSKEISFSEFFDECKRLMIPYMRPNNIFMNLTGNAYVEYLMEYPPMIQTIDYLFLNVYVSKYALIRFIDNCLSRNMEMTKLFHYITKTIKFVRLHENYTCDESIASLPSIITSSIINIINKTGTYYGTEKEFIEFVIEVITFVIDKFCLEQFRDECKKIITFFFQFLDNKKLSTEGIFGSDMYNIKGRIIKTMQIIAIGLPDEYDISKQIKYLINKEIRQRISKGTINSNFFNEYPMDYFSLKEIIDFIVSFLKKKYITYYEHQISTFIFNLFTNQTFHNTVPRGFDIEVIKIEILKFYMSLNNPKEIISYIENIQECYEVMNIRNRRVAFFGYLCGDKSSILCRNEMPFTCFEELMRFL